MAVCDWRFLLDGRRQTKMNGVKTVNNKTGVVSPGGGEPGPLLTPPTETAALALWKKAAIGVSVMVVGAIIAAIALWQTGAFSSKVCAFHPCGVWVSGNTCYVIE